MPQLIAALLKSLSTFARPGLLRFLIVPPLLGALVWVISAVLWLGALTDWLLAETPLAWLNGVLLSWHLGWLVSVLAFVGAWIVLLAGATLVAVVVTGVWALPGLVNHLARTDYADLEPRGRDSLLLSIGVTLRASLLYLLGWGLTLPVWLIPGMAMVHSLFWLAYLNRATFAFDALAVHASREEWDSISKGHSGRLWTLGFMAALLTHLPLAGFFAPALAAASFVHYGFAALRAERMGPADGAIEGEVIEVIRG